MAQRESIHTQGVESKVQRFDVDCAKIFVGQDSR